MVYLITGGSGCGKSAYAEKLVSRLSAEQKYYIATMQVYDEESVKRVERHRAQRAELGFTTLEIPKDLASADIAADSIVLLEDLVNITANEIFDGGDSKRIIPALRTLAEKSSHLIIVTNDLFSDGITYAESTDMYLKKIAAINNEAAKLADCVIEVVYSIPIALKGDLPCV